MKTKMFHATLVLLMCSFVSSMGAAEERYYEDYVPVDNIDVEDSFPITKCIPPKQEGALRDLRSMTRTALQLSQCGNYEGSIAYLQESIDFVAYLAKTNKPIHSKIGRCFSRKNCKSRISSQKVTKKHCKSTLLGASWQQVHPTLGKCQNI